MDSAVRANARTAWDEFFKQRKDADADLPILQRSENGVCPLAPVMPVGNEAKYLQASTVHPFMIATTVEVKQGQRFAGP